MNLTFLTPLAGLVALVAVLPLAALALVSRRAQRVRALLHLPGPGASSHVPAAAAICLLAALLGLAAAQPVVAGSAPALERTDVEALFVIDTSRSMLAAPGPAQTTRFERARDAALRLRAQVPEVRVGLASLTDRLLPHLFPTVDARVFDDTLRRSIGVDRPPPAVPQQTATTYAPLGSVTRANFFSRDVRRRALVVLTDGEANPTSPLGLQSELEPAQPIAVQFVRVWAPGERVFLPNGRPEEAYHSDAGSGAALGQFARAVGAKVFDEDQLGAAEAALRHAVGNGPATKADEGSRPRALAPYAAVIALVPLLFLLWTRNRA